MRKVTFNCMNPNGIEKLYFGVIVRSWFFLSFNLINAGNGTITCARSFPLLIAIANLRPRFHLNFKVLMMLIRCSKTSVGAGFASSKGYWAKIFVQNLPLRYGQLNSNETMELDASCQSYLAILGPIPTLAA